MEYVIISPVKDEASFIEGTLRSVERQTLKPRRWLIVNDGSRDATAGLVQEHTVRNSFIELIDHPQQGNANPVPQ